MGSSGCGKTTLLSCITGILKADNGSLEVLGKHSNKIPSSCIGFMPQDSALIESFKVQEMFWFFGTLFGLNSDEIKKKHQEFSSLLELPKPNKFIKTCSGGEKQRISLALTLIHDPDLLLLDEPTVGGMKSIKTCSALILNFQWIRCFANASGTI
jgi:ABC-type multidrug transport system ATPase subunit